MIRDPLIYSSSPLGDPTSLTGLFLAPRSPSGARSSTHISTVSTIGSEESLVSSYPEEQFSAPSPNSCHSSLGLGTLEFRPSDSVGKSGDKKKINERVRRNDNTRLVQEMQDLLVAENWDSALLSNPNQRSGLKFNKLKIMKEFIGRFRTWKMRCESLENEILRCQTWEHFLVLRSQLNARNP